MKKILLILLAAVIAGVVIFLLNTQDFLVDKTEDFETTIESNTATEEEVGDRTDDYLFLLEEKLIGRWISLENEAGSFILRDDHTLTEIYNGGVVATGSWELKEEKGEFDISFYLTKTTDEADYKYEMLSVDDESLSLMVVSSIYVDRGVVLEYKKEKD